MFRENFKNFIFYYFLSDSGALSFGTVVRLDPQLRGRSTGSMDTNFVLGYPSYSRRSP